MMEKGLIYFGDILNNEGNVYGYEEFCQKFDVSLNFIDYSLTHSIPTYWKLYVRDKSPESTNDSFLQIYMKNILKKKLGGRGVYWSLVKSKKLKINI